MVGESGEDGAIPAQEISNEQDIKLDVSPLLPRLKENLKAWKRLKRSAIQWAFYQLRPDLLPNGKEDKLYCIACFDEPFVLPRNPNRSTFAAKGLITYSSHSGALPMRRHLINCHAELHEQLQKELDREMMEATEEPSAESNKRSSPEDLGLTDDVLRQTKRKKPIRTPSPRLTKNFSLKGQDSAASVDGLDDELPQSIATAGLPIGDALSQLNASLLKLTNEVHLLNSHIAMLNEQGKKQSDDLQHPSSIANQFEHDKSKKVKEHNIKEHVCL